MGEIVPYQPIEIAHFIGPAEKRMALLAAELARFERLVSILRKHDGSSKRTLELVRQVYGPVLQKGCAVENALAAITDCAYSLYEEIPEGEAIVLCASNDDETVEVSLETERWGAVFHVYRLDFTIVRRPAIIPVRTRAIARG